MVSTTPGRQATTPDLPAGRYEINPGASRIGFDVQYLKVARGHGVFTLFAGEIVVGDPIAESSVQVTIDAASVDTINHRRDDHLRSSDFLSMSEYPLIVFQSQSVKAGGRRLLVHGDLQIRGVSRPVVLDAAFQGAVVDPWGVERIVFSAGTTIDRVDWGMTWNFPLDGGGVFVGRTIRIDLDVQAARVA
ncbi:MAG TPA: YceI family protein [Thermomicrobiales bacterium]|nr:YceI family protein [Thermomicrobiales bacterium]